MTRLITSKTSTVKKIAASGVKNTSSTIPFNTGSFPESESTYELNYTLVITAAQVQLGDVVEIIY
jgi:hypothetical protein